MTTFEGPSPPSAGAGVADGDSASRPACPLLRELISRFLSNPYHTSRAQRTTTRADHHSPEDAFAGLRPDGQREEDSGTLHAHRCTGERACQLTRCIVVPAVARIRRANSPTSRRIPPPDNILPAREGSANHCGPRPPDAGWTGGSPVSQDQTPRQWTDLGRCVDPNPRFP